MRAAADKGGPRAAAKDKGAPASVGADKDKEKEKGDHRAASYDELLRGATRVGSSAAGSTALELSELLEPLVAECPKGGGIEARQCEAIRTWHLEHLRGERLVAVGDSSSVLAQPYDAAEKSLTLTVTGCVACRAAPKIHGATMIVVTKPPRSVVDGYPTGIDLGFHDVPQPDVQAAKRWMTKTFPRVRVEYVFTVAEPFTAGSARGIRVSVLGHRVFNRCSGQVLASDPPSTVTAIKGDPTCPKEVETEDELREAREYAALPEAIGPPDIEKAMAPVRERVDECASTFELKGTLHVRMVIKGRGEGHEMKLQPPFDTGDAALCFRQALKLAKFPRFKRDELRFDDYPFTLHPQ